jgi:hypothetical protein
MEAILFHKEKDADIFQQEIFHEFRKEATNQVNSKTGCLLTPSKDNLVIDLNKSGFEVMDQLPPPTLDTHSLELEHLFSPSDESSPMSNLLTFEWAFHLGL